MVIKTAVKPKGPSLPSKRPLGTLYEVAKLGLKSLGYYNEIKQYDPGFWVQKYRDRYSYKPRKRLTAYALQTRGFLKKAPFANRRFRKTRGRLYNSPGFDKCSKNTGKGSYCSQ